MEAPPYDIISIRREISADPNYRRVTPLNAPLCYGPYRPYGSKVNGGGGQKINTSYFFFLFFFTRAPLA